MDALTERRILAALDEYPRLKVPQAERLGISRITLKRAADAGLIRRARRGEYARLSPPGSRIEWLRQTAADVDPRAVLAVRGAAAFYGLDAIDGQCVEWIVPHGGPRPSSPLVHRRRRFEDIEVELRGGLLVTSPRQTLADLGAHVDLDILERATESALRLKLVTELALRDFAYIFLYKRHGGAALRAVLDRRPIGARPTDSDIETRLLQVYRHGNVRVPERQWAIYGADGTVIARVDCGFPPLAFGTEVDGFESHGTPEALQYDLNRQNAVEDTGFTLRRFTHNDVAYRRRYVCTETLRGMLLARPL